MARRIATPVAPQAQPSGRKHSPSDPPAARRRRWIGQRVWGTAKAVVVPVAAVLCWWLLSVAGVYPESVLPSPVRVADALWTWLFGPDGAGPYSGNWAEAAAASGRRVAVGFLIASVAGVLLGVLIGYFRGFGELFDPLVQLLRPIPVTAWVPLSLVFFGFGFGGAVFLIALGAFFPIVVNTTEGVRGSSGTLVRVGRMLGANTYQLLRRFILPAALPGVFVGLRLGIGISWVLVIVAELLSVKAGVGYTLLDAYAFGRYDVIIAAMISLGVLGFVSDRVIVLVQRVALRWHREVSIHGA